MKGAADAEAQHHELRDAQVIHEPEVVVRCRHPKGGRLRAGRRTSPPLAVGANPPRFTRLLALDSSIGLNGWFARPATVEFSRRRG